MLVPSVGQANQMAETFFVMLNKLRDFAVRFRAIIDAADRSTWGVVFKSFPRGSCGAVSEMFGTYLLEEKSIESSIVHATHSGGFGAYGSHAWLKVSDVILDLAGDQFQHDPLPVPFVDTDRTWHDQWTIDSSTPFDRWLDINRDQMFFTWGNAYRDILRALERAE